MAATEPTTHSFDDLAVWRTSLPGVQYAILPPSSDRPNPRLSGGMLFASVFAPGCVCALDATTGEIRWRRELPYLGGSSVELAGNLVLAKTGQGVYALDRSSGNVRWEFCPHGLDGETVYSEPALDGTRLFLGDRLGWLHCLDSETGQTIWKRETSDRDASVNATAVVVSGLVITATNAGLALAYSVEDGRPVWQSELDGPCTNHVFLVERHVVAAAESLYFLEPGTGALQGRVQWPGLVVAFAAGTPSRVVLLRRPHDEPPEKEALLMYDGVRLTHESRCSRYAQAVRYSHATGLLYVSGMMGLDILDPDTGKWLHTARGAESTSGHGLPEVAGNRIYAMNGEGVVCALQHPNRAPAVVA